MLLRSLKLTRLLSFGPHEAAVELRPLNLLVGPNGSGKSNFIEAIGLLQAAPRELARPIREGGGVRAWMWRGAEADRHAPDRSDTSARIEAVLDRPGAVGLRHRLSFTEVDQRFAIDDERIEPEGPATATRKAYFFFGYENGSPMLNVGGKTRR
jgi:predicted ATPase